MAVVLGSDYLLRGLGANGGPFLVVWCRITAGEASFDGGCAWFRLPKSGGGHTSVVTNFIDLLYVLCQIIGYLLYSTRVPPPVWKGLARSGERGSLSMMSNAHHYHIINVYQVHVDLCIKGIFIWFHACLWFMLVQWNICYMLFWYACLWHICYLVVALQAF